MNGTSPVISQTLTTIEAPAAAPEATPGPEKTAPPAQGNPGAASAVAPKRDRDLDLARKFEEASKHTSRSRQLAKEAEAKLAGLSEREKKLAEREAELEEALGDPVGHMLKIGKDPLEVAKRYAKPESPEEKRIRKLEEAAEQREAEDAKRRQDWETQQQHQARISVERKFVGSITAKECPNLTTLYQANEIPGMVYALLNRPSDPEDPGGPTMKEAFVAQYGRVPSDAELREGLEYEAEVRATSILEAYRRRQAAAASVATSPGSPAQSSSKNESGPNGISNKHAAGTSSPVKRPLSLEEKRKKNRKDLTAALEAEAGDD